MPLAHTRPSISQTLTPKRGVRVSRPPRLVCGVLVLRSACCVVCLRWVGGWVGGWVGRHAAGVRVCFLLPQLEAKQKETGIKLLWGTANLFSHARSTGSAGYRVGTESQ